MIHSLSGGGAERVMASLASRLALREHAVTLITLDDGSSDRHDLGSDVGRITLNVMGASESLWDKLSRFRARYTALRNAIVDTRADVVLSFCDRTNIETLIAAKRTGIPVVVSERSDPRWQTLGSFWEWMRRRTYRRAARVIALTETTAEFLRPLNPRTVVIPSAIECPPIRSDRVAAQLEKMIIGVGRLEPEKGFDRLIEAFAIATTQHPDWRLKILGDGSQRETLIGQAKSLNIAHRVEMPGWVRPIWEPLSRATIFALASRYEGFPSALMEAMASGVPSVSVDCPSGPREIIRDGDNGRLCGNDVSSLADAISELISQDEKREHMGIQGTEIVQRYSWDKMVCSYETVLQDVVSNR
ncbi:glycosyltransferase family 4 protein [Stieleria varia]|uniref:glycosyltransferase family 4 protein n=1 Tax=Stieleria varia TaxID=2528005 RepID=UPI00313E084F